MKTCTTCKQTLPLGMFSKRAQSKDGLRSDCKPCAAEQQRRYKRRYHEANREEIAERKRRYYEANPHLARAQVARHRAAKLQRTARWSDAVAIATLHAIADRVSACLGIKHHVDHVIPLRGRKVSGLHVHTNLRVLPAPLNLRKGNRFEVGA